MNIKSLAVIALLSLFPAAQSFAADEKPDLRDVRWGMSKEEVKKHEKAEIVKETEGILVYLIKAVLRTKLSSPNPTLKGRHAMRQSIDIEVPDYDLVYLFPTASSAWQCST